MAGMMTEWPCQGSEGGDHILRAVSCADGSLHTPARADWEQTPSALRLERGRRPARVYAGLGYNPRTVHDSVGPWGLPREAYTDAIVREGEFDALLLRRHVGAMCLCPALGCLP